MKTEPLIRKMKFLADKENINYPRFLALTIPQYKELQETIGCPSVLKLSAPQSLSYRGQFWGFQIYSQEDRRGQAKDRRG